MARKKSLEERLMGAAVLKVSFEQRQEAQGPAFQGLYQGILQDLELDEATVDAFIAEHRAEVEAKIRAGRPSEA